MNSMIAFVLRHKNHFWLLVSIAVAFGLRVSMLGAQSLWNDEGTSVALASLNLPAIIDGAAKDIHPPLYYFLLHFWMPFVGNTEYAVRFLSVIAGVLVVAVTFRIARFCFDEEVAIIAAFFSAFSPFQVYYSQETRMYIWATLFAAVSVYAMARVLETTDCKASRRDRRLRTGVWFIYLASTIAALYTHYFAATLILFENLAFGVWLFLTWRAFVVARSGRTTEVATLVGDSGDHDEAISNDQAKIALLRRLRQEPTSQPQNPLLAMTDSIPPALGTWVAAQIVIVLAFLPWYLFAGNQLSSWPAISEPFDIVTLLWRVLNVFSVGLSLDPGSAFLIAIAFGMLFVLGLRWKRGWHEDWSTSVLVLWTLVPVVFMYAVSLLRPAYNPKFLLVATPAFFILAARGLSRIHPGIFLHRRHPAIEFRALRFFFFGISAIAAIGFIPSLRNYYDNPRYARDDYRAILNYIDSSARPGDGILVDAPGQMEVVRYYSRGAQPFFPLPRMRPPDPTATRADVDAMLSQVQRLYAIYWATTQSDPQGIIETRLAEKAFKARDEWHGDVRLAVYGVAPVQRDAPRTLNAKFGDEITLVSYGVDVREVRIGDIVTLTLNWHADRTPSARYKVFVHLLDASNRVIAQRDGEPASDTRLTTTWRAGENIADNYGILIEPETPPGEYGIEMGMYRADNGARLPVGNSDHLILGTVTVK